MVLPSSTCSSSPTRSSGYVAQFVESCRYFSDSNHGQVENAVREIKRLLIEASTAALQAEMRNPTAPSGRYSVV
jgi:hypothetical protein